MKSVLFTSLIFIASIASAQIENFHSISDEIDRSARPTAEQVDWVSQNGYTTILNLEAGNFSSKPGYVKDEEKQAAKLGLKFFHISMHPTQGPSKEQIDAALEIMINPANQPILIHCHHGKDRTGMVAAAYRMKYQGWTYEKAVEEMNSYGFSSTWFSGWLEVLKEYDTHQ